MVLARLWPILLICPTQVLLPPFSMLVFVPLEADLCGRHPPGSLTLWLQGLANREPWWVWEGGRRERSECSFPWPLPCKATLGWLYFLTEACFLFLSRHNSLPFQVLVTFLFTGEGSSAPPGPTHSFHAAFTWINNPSRNFPNQSSPPAAGWDPNVYHVSLLPVFPGNWQLNLEAWPDSE